MIEKSITHIDISKDYDETQGTDDVHYQSFSRMAAFFGRDMQAHRADAFSHTIDHDFASPPITFSHVSITDSHSPDHPGN
ncbi:hypothetical protein LFZ16_04035 [Salmonella enterica subsp. enterica serovar India str. SA20085604]|nr:hypothetical protein LFZ16_04035 [Salmonella enterica subsp. enterica serovar India str. SA20085604]